MSDARIPTEVELVYEVMPCNALRTAQEPSGAPHPCTYFRTWGTYHSYDYAEDGPPPTPGIVQEATYVGRAPLVPELLSGCRKAPILAVGINPNLPGFWPWSRNAVNPLFDDYKQFAHYFRYRTLSKLEIPDDEYAAYGGGPHDTPAAGQELHVPRDDAGRRPIGVQPKALSMYRGYQDLLDRLAAAMGWDASALTVGEDVSYGNMVGCPSARWTTRPDPRQPDLPPMTPAERRGIVSECFHTRAYFLRQLFQSLPAVLLVFSQSTANALIGELQDRFSAGAPRPGDSLADLADRHVRLAYGDLPDGSTLDARVIFAPHITGDPEHFGPARDRVVAQLVEEAEAGRIRFNPTTGHLSRGRGGCVFCPMLEIGPCDYEAEIEPLADPPQLFAGGPAISIETEKAVQTAIRVAPSAPADAWALTDEPLTDLPGSP